VNPVNEHGDMIAISAYYKLQAQVDDLQRQLDNARTDWLCDTCNGRGCEAENQNTILLAELEKLQRDNAVLREQIDDWEDAVLHALDHRSDEQHCTCVPPLLWKMKQLERKYAALEKLIIKVGYIITTFNGEMALCRDPWHQPKEEQP
jgi:hypothetical protein